MNCRMEYFFCWCLDVANRMPCTVALSPLLLYFSFWVKSSHFFRLSSFISNVHINCKDLDFYLTLFSSKRILSFSSFVSLGRSFVYEKKTRMSQCAFPLLYFYFSLFWLLNNFFFFRFSSSNSISSCDCLVPFFSLQSTPTRTHFFLHRFLFTQFSFGGCCFCIVTLITGSNTCTHSFLLR